ncbi:hypothetical protein A2866_03820 [Candidatus Roizmanbacteria bacterium RIFCSPHIGHO2_01_FULL_39_8]|uniref:Wzt C-terminal domain-containing protein n=2 Tax=Candidatus Roizmaniibacteriota TaxID=1752723 RepID=A0A1F7GRQ0_9BACT|nr:MAG: hypothetical protein A2866_03820 [Candidatus Roizmanbacteria bacterium RIFCSPHIGHO2_01_FULL_39_8]OGK35669.1 MAG: hypothetical protein A3F60_01160 [Candidatus Roizmanbacteria bacterium RIFCSPHIGHO2_12_FULL_39_8]
MKLKTEIVALCDYANISREGKININGVFDEVRVQNFPGGIARAFFVAVVRGTTNQSYNLTLKVESEKNTPSPLKPLPINIQTSFSGKSNILVELANIVFQNPGDYQFTIYENQELVGSTMLKVLHGSYEKRKDTKPN